MAYNFLLKRISVLIVTLAVMASVLVTSVSYAKWTQGITSISTTLTTGQIKLFGFSEYGMSFTTNEKLIPYDESEVKSGMTKVLTAYIPEYYVNTAYTLTISLASTNFSTTTEFYAYVGKRGESMPTPFVGWSKLNATYEYNDITKFTIVNDKVLYLALSSFDADDMEKPFSISLTLGCTHAFTSYTIVSEPTCTQDGEKSAECDYCTQKSNLTISSLGHSFTKYEVVTAGNCTIDKVERAKCDNCEQTDEKITPAIGSHSYGSNGICTRCGQSSIISDNQVTLLSDGTYAITAVADKSVSTFTFPSTHNGIPVTKIDGSGFLFVSDRYGWNDTLKSVVIPDSVTTIGETAFYHCRNLQSVTMSDNLESIGEGAFDVGGTFSGITLGEKLTEIGVEAFWGCKFTEITYKGTKEQWKRIKKGRDWNKNTQNYIVRCTDGILTKAESEIQIS